MLGWKPAKWKDYEPAINDMRAWMKGEPVDVEGAPGPVQLTWADREVPMVLGVFGPRGCELAGRLGDIATTECAELGAVEWFNSDVQKAAKAAGRDPVTFEVSICCYVSNDMAKARDMCRWEPEIITNLLWQLMRTYGIDALPESLTRGFEWLAEERGLVGRARLDAPRQARREAQADHHGRDRRALLRPRQPAELHRQAARAREARRQPLLRLPGPGSSRRKRSRSRSGCGARRSSLTFSNTGEERALLPREPPHRHGTGRSRLPRCETG